MMLLEVTGVSLLTDGFSALTSAISFVTGNSILVLPVAIGLGCFAIRRVKGLVRR